MPDNQDYITDDIDIITAKEREIIKALRKNPQLSDAVPSILNTDSKNL